MDESDGDSDDGKGKKPKEKCLSTEEEACFLKLLEECDPTNVIDSQQTGSTSLGSRKKVIWDQIIRRFNNETGRDHSKQQLLRIKRRLVTQQNEYFDQVARRKEARKFMKECQKTGGGTPPRKPEPCDIDEDSGSKDGCSALHYMQHRGKNARPLENPINTPPQVKNPNFILNALLGGNVFIDENNRVILGQVQSSSKSMQSSSKSVPSSSKSEDKSDSEACGTSTTNPSTSKTEERHLLLSSSKAWRSSSMSIANANESGDRDKNNADEAQNGKMEEEKKTNGQHSAQKNAAKRVKTSHKKSENEDKSHEELKIEQTKLINMSLRRAELRQEQLHQMEIEARRKENERRTIQFNELREQNQILFELEKAVVEEKLKQLKQLNIN